MVGFDCYRDDGGRVSVRIRDCKPKRFFETRDSGFECVKPGFQIRVYKRT